MGRGSGIDVFHEEWDKSDGGEVRRGAYRNVLYRPKVILGVVPKISRAEF